MDVFALQKEQLAELLLSSAGPDMILVVSSIEEVGLLRGLQQKLKTMKLISIHDFDTYIVTSSYDGLATARYLVIHQCVNNVISCITDWVLDINCGEFQNQGNNNYYYLVETISHLETISRLIP